SGGRDGNAALHDAHRDGSAGGRRSAHAPGAARTGGERAARRAHARRAPGRLLAHFPFGQLSPEGWTSPPGSKRTAGASGASRQASARRVVVPRRKFSIVIVPG